VILFSGITQTVRNHDTHGVSGIDWKHYKHPLPENVFVGVHMLTMEDMEKQGLVDLAGMDHFKDTIQEALLDRVSV
jgi:hypothetical protein